MSDGGGSKAQEYRRLITQLQDVVAAKVCFNEAGALETIHVLAGAERSPKQVLRDIESALMARFGVEVDRQQITLAQVGNEVDDLLERSRLSLEEISCTVQGSQARCRVRLRYGGQTCEGTVHGAASTEGWLRLVAEATLRALESYFEAHWLFSIEEVVTVPLGCREAVVVSIVYLGHQGEEYFVGSSLLRHDEKEAAARATLDAINRRFSLLLKE